MDYVFIISNFGVMVILKRLILKNFSLGACGGLEGTDLQYFTIFEDLVVWKGMSFNNSYLERVRWS